MNFTVRPCNFAENIVPWLNPSSLQTNTDTFANSVDPDETARRSRLIWIFIVCHSVIFFTKPLFATMDVSKFRDGYANFRKSGVKGLIHVYFLFFFFFFFFFFCLQFQVLALSNYLFQDG